MKKSNRVFKMIAVTVILALVINLLPDIFGTYKAMAAEGGNSSSTGIESYSGKFELQNGSNGSAKIPYTTQLTETSDGYRLVLTMDPETTLESANKDRTVGDNGYFTAEITGDYMVEIVGGKGGQGAKQLFDGSGRAGAAGHVYGVVHLNAGDTLFYSIGGNGIEDMNTLGGGNGGAGHGDDGYVKIGTGGGYTAVYLFSSEDPSGDFSSYIDEDGKLVKKSIDEADRTTKVIMVAGGGGGGGADGSDISINNRPDGGNAGSIGGSSVIVSDGVIFPGQNGKSSSGSNTSFTGKGGSNIPGKAVTSNNSFIGRASSEAGKSWTEGGNGGKGNLYGGGGGAGYNGASGGVMNSPLSSYDVGGGGGGSSFIKSSVVKYDNLTGAEEIALLTKEQISDIQDLGNNNGGIFHITALNSYNQLAFMNNISLGYEVSKYFTATVSTKYGDENEHVDVKDNPITDINFINDNNGGNKIVVTFDFERKEGFVGGNDVPLFTDNKVTLTYLNDKTIDISLEDNCAYVNVPLDGFEAEGNNAQYIVKDSDGNTDSEIIYGDLFNDAGVRNSAASAIENGRLGENDWKYDFIEGVSGYCLDGDPIENTTEILASNDKKIHATKWYTVSFKVTPKAGSKAYIGKYQEATNYSAPAVIQYIAHSAGKINGDDITKDLKTLTYNDNGTYTLKYESTITYNQKPAIVGKKVDTSNVANCKDNKSLDPGYYYIHIWGADGGKGHDAKDGGKGANGGKGAELEGVIHIKESYGLNCVVGTGGAYGPVKYEGSILQTNYGGYGGTASSISIGGMEIIAGGGGGGGAASGRYSNTDDVGKDGLSIELSSSSSYNSYNGESINDKAGPSSFGSVHYGQGGKSSIHKDLGFVSISEFTNAHTAQAAAIISNAQSAYSKTSDWSTGKGADGKVVIVRLEDYSYAYEPDTTYSFSTNISKYFDIAKDTNGKYMIKVTVPEGSETNGKIGSTGSVTINKDSQTGMTSVNVKDFVLGYSLPEEKDENDRISDLSYSVEITLKPIDGFLGGNDVPVIDESVGSEIKITQGGSSYDSPKNTVTDYANVALNIGAIRSYFENNEDAFKVYNDNKNNVDELTYVLGYAPVEGNKVCTGTAFGSSVNDVQKAFVDIKDVTAGSAYNPSQATNYEFTFSVEPVDINTKKPAKLPTKAIVGVVCEDYSLTKYQKVDVKSSIKFDLDNISVKGISSLKGPTKDEPDVIWNIENTYDYTCELVPSMNYSLPQAVKISYKVYNENTGEDITEDCYYDYLSGELIIPYYELKNNSVLVKAAAIAPEDTYTVTYIYPVVENVDGTNKLKVDENGDVVYQTVVDKGPVKSGETESKGYKAGDAVYDLANGILPSDTYDVYTGEDGSILVPVFKIDPPSIYGYDFKWDSSVTEYITPDENNVRKMPAQNLRFIGSYVPKEVILTINYLDISNKSTPMCDPYTSIYYPDETDHSICKSSLNFDDSYNVVSPSIDGYTPEDGNGNSLLTVSGKITEFTTDPDTNKNYFTVNVYYRSTAGKVVVNFVNEDGTTATGKTPIEYKFDFTSVTSYGYKIDLENSDNSTSDDENFKSKFSNSYSINGYDIYINGDYSSVIEDSISVVDGKTESKTYTVKYIGQDVTISFNSGVGELDNPKPIKVQYDNTVGYVKTDSTREYKELPKLYRDGYSHTGWVIEGTSTAVTENTKVTDEFLNGVTLLAVWESFDFTVTINFVGRYEQDGKTMYKSKALGTKSVTGNKEHTEYIELPSFTGYLIGGEYVVDNEKYKGDSLNPETPKYMNVATSSTRSETVYYDLQKYTLTINLVDEKGNTIWDKDGDGNYSDAYVESYYFDESYSFMCPGISSNKLNGQPYESVSQSSVSGKMPAQNLTFTIIYFNAQDAPVISVTITWEPLDFFYTEGTWNPETHSYGNGAFSPTTKSGAYPKITVCNNSTVPIEANLSYRILTSYNEISASLDKTKMNLGINSSDSSEFKLNGKMRMDVGYGKPVPVGSVTVKISRGSSSGSSGTSGT